MEPLCAEFFCRDLMEQLLKPAEGTQKAAYHPAQQNTDEQQETHYIVGKMKFRGADHGLNRPDGTGGRRSRTGVAIQSRDADPFQLSTRDLPLKEV